MHVAPSISRRQLALGAHVGCAMGAVRESVHVGSHAASGAHVGCARETHRENFVDNANKRERSGRGELTAPPRRVSDSNSNRAREKQGDPCVWLWLVVVMELHVLHRKPINVLRGGNKKNHHQRVTSYDAKQEHKHTHTQKKRLHDDAHTLTLICSLSQL